MDSTKISPKDILKLGDIKGAEYSFPKRQAVQFEIEKRLRETVEEFGYDEVNGPILQPYEFYAVKSGQDLLTHTYSFKSKNKTLLLRPEMTPTIAYMIASQEGQLSFPQRWWSNPTIFRRENTQQGRRREFKQLNVDILDLKDANRDPIYADCEIIAVCCAIYTNLGLGSSEIVLKINSRALVNDLFDLLILSDDQKGELLFLIDSKEKISPENFSKDLSDILKNEESEEIINKWVNMKNLTELENTSQFNELTQKESYKDLVRLFKLLNESYKVNDYCEFSPIVVRGLGYYTGTVFEAFDRKPELGGTKRALMGGGRYDNLTQDMGGKKVITGVGFGFGQVPLEDILRVRNINVIDEKKSLLDYFITVQSGELSSDAISIAQDLRAKGLKVRIDDSIAKQKVSSIGDQLRNALDCKAKTVIGLYPQEWGNGEIVLKQLDSREQTTINYKIWLESLSK